MSLAAMTTVTVVTCRLEPHPRRNQRGGVWTCSAPALGLGRRRSLRIPAIILAHTKTAPVADSLNGFT